MKVLLLQQSWILLRLFLTHPFVRTAKKTSVANMVLTTPAPPDCGSPEEMKQRILAHKKALVLQTIWQVADYSDVPAIKHAKKSHNAAEIRVVKKLREAGHDGLIVGASGCALCTPCAQTQGLPCKFPDLKYSCMSAYCIFVKKLADKCGMDYDCGDGLLAFFGMYVFD